VVNWLHHLLLRLLGFETGAAGRCPIEPLRLSARRDPAQCTAVPKAIPTPVNNTVVPIADARRRRQLRRAAQAINIQNASNLSGVSHSLVELCCELLSEGVSTANLRHTAEVRLYVAKLADMCGFACDYPREDEVALKALLDHPLVDDSCGDSPA
jgi:hypothetical protein